MMLKRIICFLRGHKWDINYWFMPYRKHCERCELKIMMSKTYYVQGYVDVRVFIDTDVNSTSGASGNDVAKLITMNVENRVGRCEMVGHSLIIDGINK